MKDWGAFFNETTMEYHVVPCDENREPLQPHEFEQFCICNPDIEPYNDGTTVITHKDGN